MRISFHKHPAGFDPLNFLQFSVLFCCKDCICALSNCNHCEGKTGNQAQFCLAVTIVLLIAPKGNNLTMEFLFYSAVIFSNMHFNALFPRIATFHHLWIENPWSSAELDSYERKFRDEKYARFIGDLRDTMHVKFNTNLLIHATNVWTLF